MMKDQSVAGAGAGFTLIEALVVAAILAMVASVVFIRIQTYRMRLRDAEREAQMTIFQDALALYITEKRTFPHYDAIVITGRDPFSQELIDAGVIRSVKPDPLNIGAHVYTYDSPSGATYAIFYSLETDSIPGKAKGHQSVVP